jgi:hypothetical protein
MLMRIGFSLGFQHAFEACDLPKWSNPLQGPDGMGAELSTEGQIQIG